METDNNSQIPTITDEMLPAQQPRFLQKTLDAARLVQAGLTPREALQHTNMSNRISGDAVTKFKKKLLKYSLTDPDMVKPARNVLKDILQGKPRREDHTKATPAGEVVEYTDNVYPSHSNQIAVAAMVYDRYDPVRQAGVGNTQINIGNIITGEAASRIAEAMSRLPIIEAESQPQGRPAESLGVDLGVSEDSDPGK